MVPEIIEPSELSVPEGESYEYIGPNLVNEGTNSIYIFKSDGTCSKEWDPTVDDTTGVIVSTGSWSYKEEMRHFIQCIQSGEPFRSPASDKHTRIYIQLQYPQ